jgi:feruloyl esterase
MTRLSAQYVWVAQALHKDASSFIPAEKLPVLHDAVVQACDARDGVKDGVLENPSGCKFDPMALECKSGDSPSCLTSSQVEAARKVYSGSINPRTKEIVYPGLALGSELGWSVGVGQVTPEPIALATGIFKYVIFNDPSWDYRTFDFDRDTARSDKVGTAGIDAIDPDLSEFFSRGGKLIQYHGWTDPGISPQNSINYYQNVVRAVRGSSKVDDSYRLFMVPGMDHCRGGEGADTFDVLSAIDQWVEQKKAPERMTASRVRSGKTDRTRPLCPYPQVAVYSGAGSTDDAGNFTCRVP